LAVKVFEGTLDGTEEHYKMILGLIYDVFVMLVGSTELHYSDRTTQRA
jgi:hypothetical protein